MAIKRRTFLTASALLPVVAALPARSFSTTRQGFVIGASRLSESEFAVTKVNLKGERQWVLPLPSRGHATAIHSENNIGVTVARRPGNTLNIFQLTDGKALQTTNVIDTIKLNGHAVWFGNQLLVSASDTQTSETRLLAFEWKPGVQKLVQTAEAKLPYIGPHEIRLEGESLWIAIGGLHTDGRTVLNKSNFNSGLLKFSLKNWQVESFFESPTEGVSWRHITVDNNRVFIAGQYQLEPQNSPPLLYSIVDGHWEAFKTPKPLWRQLKGYIGSIEHVNGLIIATSPRAHWLGQFNDSTLELTNQMLTHDICALAHDNDRLFAGTGTGKLIAAGSVLSSGVIWDNHFTYSDV